MVIGPRGARVSYVASAALKRVMTRRSRYWGRYSAMGSSMRIFSCCTSSITPADVISQVFLSVPLVGLYFLGVGGAFLFGRRRQPDAAEGQRLQAQ